MAYLGRMFAEIGVSHDADGQYYVYIRIIDQDPTAKMYETFDLSDGWRVITAGTPEIDTLPSGKIYIKGTNRATDAICWVDNPLQGYEYRLQLINHLKMWAEEYPWKIGPTISPSTNRLWNDNGEFYLF